MLYYDVLDEIAEVCIPNTMHKELHINPREIWIQIMSQLIEHNAIGTRYEELLAYASKWEELLYKRFSSVN